MSLNELELNCQLASCEQQMVGVGENDIAYIILGKWRALIAQAREANALRAEVEKLRAENAGLRKRAALADEMYVQIDENNDYMSSWDEDWCSRYAASQEPK